MLACSLQSGSCGNCYFYQSGDVKLLFDAGISWRTAENRLATRGLSAAGIRGIFISHDHSDHTCGAGVFQRKLKAPLFATKRTHAAMRMRVGKLKPSDVEVFENGDTVTIGHVRVHTLPTPHDAAEPCAFIVDDGQTRLGVLTDLGHGFSGLKECLSTLDAVFMESNYDDDMLTQNRNYGEHLKRRIRSPQGHLENTESAHLLKDYTDGRLRHVYLSHLSAENNCPDIALKTHRNILGSRKDLALLVAPRTGPSTVLRMEQAARPPQQLVLF